MNIELFEAIEKPRFSSEVNLASGSKTFFGGLREHPAVRELRAGLEKRPADGLQVAARVRKLAKQEIDSLFENPMDAALAAYLVVLSDLESRHTKAAAVAVQNAPNCFWSARFAQSLLGAQPSVSGFNMPVRQERPTSAFKNSLSGSVSSQIKLPPELGGIMANPTIPPGYPHSAVELKYEDPTRWPMNQSTPSLSEMMSLLPIMQTTYFTNPRLGISNLSSASGIRQGARSSSIQASR